MQHSYCLSRFKNTVESYEKEKSGGGRGSSFPTLVAISVSVPCSCKSFLRAFTTNCTLQECLWSSSEQLISRATVYCFFQNLALQIHCLNSRIIGSYLSLVFYKINALEISKDSQGRSVVEYTFRKFSGFQPAYLKNSSRAFTCYTTQSFF